MKVIDIMTMPPVPRPLANLSIKTPSTPGKPVISKKEQEIEDKLRGANILSRVHELRSEYLKQISSDDLGGVFERAQELYKSISESDDDEETKSWKTAALEDAVQIAVLGYTDKLGANVYRVGSYSEQDKDRPEWENPAADYAFLGLPAGEKKEALASFLSAAQLQELEEGANAAEMVNPEADEEALIDVDELESAELQNRIDGMAKDSSKRTESDLSKKIKALEKKAEDKETMRENENDAFFLAYLSDPERAAELQPDSIGVELGAFVLANGITNSAKRLALDFFAFVKANPNASFEELESHLNRNEGKRDLNNLSLSDLTKLAGRIGKLPYGSYEEVTAIVNWHSDSVYNLYDESDLNKLWRKENAISGIYNKYGQLYQRDLWSTRV